MPRTITDEEVIRALVLGCSLEYEGSMTDVEYEAWVRGWLSEHDAAQKAQALREWADYQEGVLVGPLSYALNDEDRAETRGWTNAARLYAEKFFGPSRESDGTDADR